MTDETRGEAPKLEIPWWGYLVPVIVVGFILFFTLMYWNTRVGTPGPVPPQPEGPVGSAAETPQAVTPGQPAINAGLIPMPPGSDSTRVDTTRIGTHY
jgi:hypothetical protein